jgi:hypothetical protein
LFSWKNFYKKEKPILFIYGKIRLLKLINIKLPLFFHLLLFSTPQKNNKVSPIPSWHLFIFLSTMIEDDYKNNDFYVFDLLVHRSIP